MGGHEIVHRQVTDFGIDPFAPGLVQAVFPGGEVAVEDRLADRAFRAEFPEDGRLGDLEVLRCQGQGFDDLVEAFDRLAELVVLGGDESAEGVGVLQVEGAAEIGARPIGQGAGFPHFLEDDGVHSAAVVLIEQLDGRILSKIQLFTAVRILDVVELTGRVGGHDNLLRRGQLLFGVGLLQRREPFGLVDRIQVLKHLPGGLRSIVKDPVLVLHQVFQAAQEVFSLQGEDLLVREGLGLEVFFPVDQIVLKGAVAGALVFLRVHAAAENVHLQLREHGLVRLGVFHQIFHDRECLGGMLRQAGDLQDAGIPADREGPFRSQGVERGSDLLRAPRGRAEVIDIGCGIGEERVVVAAPVEAEAQRGDIVFLVLLIEVFQGVMLLHFQVLPEVHEDRLDWRGLQRGDFLEEGALLVPVRHDRGDFRGIDLLDGSIFADVLVDDGAALGGEVFPGPGDDIIPAERLDAPAPAHLALPGSPVDETVHEAVGPAPVADESLHLVEFVVGLDGFEQLVGERPLAQFLDFGEQEVFHLGE